MNLRNLKNFILLLVFFTTSVVISQQNNGVLKGKIITSDGNPAAFVNVIIKNTSLGTITDDTGSFEIKSIPKGNYVLECSLLGLETKNVSFSIIKNETILNEIILKENPANNFIK